MKYDKLKELATNATEGPWGFGTFHRLLVVPMRNGNPRKHDAIADLGEGATPWDRTVSSAQEYQDAEYIAAVSPDVVLGLIDELVKKDAEIERLTSAFNDRVRIIEMQLADKEALKAEVERLTADAKRYQWLRDKSTEQLLNQSRANLNNDFSPMDIRTHWKTPTLICSGTVGGFITFEDAVDAAMERQK